MLEAIKAVQMSMNLDQLKLQTISQNISNSNTPGFKRQILEQADFPQHIQSQASELLSQLEPMHIQTPGVLNQTRNPTDIALTGAGFFQVQIDQDIFYTRRGDFQVNQQGELTTVDGALVMGKSGAIKLDDRSFRIDIEGRIFLENQQIDQLQVVQFNQPHLLSYKGEGLYQSVEQPVSIDAATQIRQGYLEQSNVKSVEEMMEMLKISRHFEATQRIMRTLDNLLGSAINQLGESNV